MNKNMKAGFQGKNDSMRDLAHRMLSKPGEAKDTYYSKTCANKDKIRPY